MDYLHDELMQAIKYYIEDTLLQAGYTLRFAFYPNLVSAVIPLSQFECRGIRALIGGDYLHIDLTVFANVNSNTSHTDMSISFTFELTDPELFSKIKQIIKDTKR